MIDRHLQPLSPPNSITLLLLPPHQNCIHLYSSRLSLCFNFGHENPRRILHPLSPTRTRSSFSTSRRRQLHQRLNPKPLFRNSFI
uniref:Uncharacterized protein n=1 Tax=Brassica campestris TaxID=3711 RepID=A0A3P5Y756_BRACM|nr:unnamed protein product [Brassica rapa]